jgi:hypothetical protein
LFKQNGENFDPSQQLQILKLELARRVLNAPVDIQEKLNELTKSEDQVRFWLRVQDIRSRLNDVAPNKQLTPEGRSEDWAIACENGAGCTASANSEFPGAPTYFRSISWNKISPIKAASGISSILGKKPVPRMP